MRRIKVDLMFNNDFEADEVLEMLIKYFKIKGIKNIVGEKSFIQYEECGHDQSPPAPCKILKRLEK